MGEDERILGDGSFKDNLTQIKAATFILR